MAWRAGGWLLPTAGQPCAGSLALACLRLPACFPLPPLTFQPTHPSTDLQVISLKPKAGQAPLAYQITVLASLSSAEVVVPDVQAGCPAVIHVIDHVLLPALGKAEDAEDEAAAGAGARKHSMLGWADLLDLA